MATINTIAVIGAGIMGRGIAHASAIGGYRTILEDLVPAALRKLRDAGFRLFTLTDNLLEVQTRQLEHGGIVDLFERRFSADGVKRHKPSPEA